MGRHGEGGDDMKFFLTLLGVLAIAAVVYVSDPLELPSLHMDGPATAKVETEHAQTMVAQLAEAGMAMRRSGVAQYAENTPDPHKDKLFGGER